LRTVDFYALASATTVPALRKSDLQRLPVPLPPLPEQQRIAEILDKADALRATRRAALAQLDTLTQSIFLDMFGDPATNPKGWPVKRIEDITECLDRLRRPVTESDRNPGDVPYYGANGQQGWIDTALFDEPLVLVAEDGGYFDAPERGVAYRIDGPAWVNNHAHILRATLKRVDTEFLHRALRHFNFLPYISGTTRAKLTQGQLNAVKLFVPPLELQREFGKQVAGVERIGRATSLSGDQLDALFCSLQHRAFRGEL
jgi:restriction endonuclease S subunit